MKAPLVAIGAVLISNSAIAGDYALMGDGTVTCADFAQEYSHFPEIENEFYAWAQGYMSGLNVARVGGDRQYALLNATSAKEQMAELREFCTQHPQEAYDHGVLALYRALPTKQYPAQK